ncbi:MAG: hypothetical protein R3C26_17150 [Calditrichia bacterium]
MGNLKLTMRTKLLAALLISSVFWNGDRWNIIVYSAENMIEQDVSNQLVSVREIKARQVENYFGFIRKQVITFSQDQMIIDAMQANSKPHIMMLPCSIMSPGRACKI